MKKVLISLLAYLYTVPTFASGIANKNYKFDITGITRNTGGKEVSSDAEENISSLLSLESERLTIILTILATIMVVVGGVYMIVSAGSSEQTGKGKSIIANAVIGVIIGLLAYIIITLVWNIIGG